MHFYPGGGKDDAVWNALVEKAQAFATPHDMEPSMPRRVGRQQHRDNVEAENPNQYWKRALYLPFLDHLTNEMSENLLQPLPGYKAQYLIPTKLHGLDAAAVDNIYKHLIWGRHDPSKEEV